MIGQQRLLAIIPARGGSKRLPRKNILNLAGKPLIAWTIEQCIQAENINDVWVSSDDNDILDIAKQYGAKIIKRPYFNEKKRLKKLELKKKEFEKFEPW